jgi:histidine triad (HIT) family protein
MDTCFICRAVRGEVPVHIIHADECCLAFLDNGPVRRGHTLIVPRMHFPYFDELPPDVAAHIMILGQRLARAMKGLYGVERAGFCYTGGDVPHAHAHVIPIHEKTDITSRRYILEENLTFRALPPVPDDELAACAAELAGAFRTAVYNGGSRCARLSNRGRRVGIMQAPHEPAGQPAQHNAP